MCKKHPNYSKWHPDEPCAVCVWDKAKRDLIKKHPNWSEKQLEQKLDLMVIS